MLFSPLVRRILSQSRKKNDGLHGFNRGGARKNIICRDDGVSEAGSQG